MSQRYRQVLMNDLSRLPQSFEKRLASDASHQREDKDLGTAPKTPLCHWSAFCTTIRPQVFFGNENTRSLRRTTMGKRFRLENPGISQGKTTVSVHRRGRSENDRNDQERRSNVEMYLHENWFGGFYLFTVNPGCAQRGVTFDNFFFEPTATCSTDTFAIMLQTLPKDSLMKIREGR